MTVQLLAPFLQRLNQSTAKTLWVVDENIDDQTLSQVQSHAQLFAITNRYDRYEALTQHAIQSNFSDFDFSIFADQSFDRVFFRISKEKAVTHFVINQIARVLKVEGELVLSGMKLDGFKSYLDKCKTLFGRGAELSNIGDGRYMATLCKGEAMSELLDDRHYNQLATPLCWQETPIYSKPGVFGWDKIDQGSALLIETLGTWLKSSAPAVEKVVDLGCGYGYLSIALASQLEAIFVATDNNAAAIVACRKNFEQFGLKGRVLADHIGSQLKPGFDLVICNPPFHAGFSVENSLTDQFLLAAKNLMRDNGTAFFVVNAFIGIEKKAERYFSQISTLANNKQFKVIQLHK